MAQSTEHGMPSDEHRILSTEYLARARAAETGGDAMLSMYLYLAAFEEAAVDEASPSEDALTGLKQAWVLACSHKERSMAEYIFEKLEPYLNADEIAICADELQSLALDKLEEFGLSREDLEDMAEMISQDLLGGDALQFDGLVEAPLPGLLGGMPSLTLRAHAKPRAAQAGDGATREGEGAKDAKDASAKDAKGAAAKGAKGAPGAAAKGRCLLPAADGGAQDEPAQDRSASPVADLMFGSEEGVLDYSRLSGYGETVRAMADFGIGVAGDEGFQELVAMLNSRHGLDRTPAADSLLFRAQAREDANRFIEATIGELKLPAVRMRMEENIQGMPVLCVSCQASDVQRPGNLRSVFDHGGVLVLEDLDLWAPPPSEMGEDMAGLFAMQLSRGATEALNMVRFAVENPDVYVLASASQDIEVAPVFLDLLTPVSFIEIGLPTPEERIDLWLDLARAHPSLRSINRADLVRYSANLPRYDICLAVREAIEEAYKLGLMQRRYQPITRENIFDKLAACHPLESDEYHELEEAVLRDFRSDIDSIESLLGPLD